MRSRGAVVAALVAGTHPAPATDSAAAAATASPRRKPTDAASAGSPDSARPPATNDSPTPPKWPTRATDPPQRLSLSGTAGWMNAMDLSDRWPLPDSAGLRD